MSLKKKANLIIYRFKEKGLEIFLVNSDEAGEQWGLPQGPQEQEHSTKLDENHMIELDPVENESAVAVEGDWHEIPSLKAMLHEDAKHLKDKLVEMEKGTFFVVKEAIKKVLPHQYKFLKELKEILVDRNSIRDL